MKSNAPYTLLPRRRKRSVLALVLIGAILTTAPITGIYSLVRPHIKNANSISRIAPIAQSASSPPLDAGPAGVYLADEVVIRPGIDEERPEISPRPAAGGNVNVTITGVRRSQIVGPVHYPARVRTAAACALGLLAVILLAYLWLNAITRSYFTASLRMTATLCAMLVLAIALRYVFVR